MEGDLAVLIVAEPGDPHADAVEAQLASWDASFARTSLNAWSQQTVEWSPQGRLVLRTAGDTWSIGHGATVWWRRPGWFDSAILAPEELELAQDEAAVMLPGALDAVRVRWVDSPWGIARARNRLVQLALASSLGIDTPTSLVTNSAGAATQFLASGSVVAKTISSGTGLAPFVDSVHLSDVGLVANAPVLLQQALHADADWRVVTVGSASFCWRRRREPSDPLDWRAVDPAGSGFQRIGHCEYLQQDATTIQNNLGLSFSVQDWVEVDGAWFFLEVNPQGQWLFLDGANELVATALAHHLLGVDVQ